MLREIKRTAVIWFINVISATIIVLIFGTQSLSREGLVKIIIITGLLGLLNTILWPILMKFLLKVAIYTFGLISLLLNSIFMYFVVNFVVEDSAINSLGKALLVSLMFTLIQTIITYFITIDDEESFNRRVLKRFLKKNYGEPKKEPGIIYLEIDGLAYPVLKKAMDEGYAPNFKKLLDNGEYNLIQWETDLSSQTGASQAGILHGTNHNMPAFRWVEKDMNNRIMTSNNPKDCPIIEKRNSNGQGLLSDDGGSRANMFSGDANDSIFTFSKLDIKNLYSPIYYSLFSDANGILRIVSLFLADVIREYLSRFQQWRKKVSPRLGREKRGKAFPFMRAFTTIILRELTIYTLIGDIYNGQRNVIYATFVGYDEVAHHSGVMDKDALFTLKKLEEQFARLLKAAEKAQRKYHFVFLSDHGQTLGATFKQRYGKTLKDLVLESIQSTNTNATVSSFLDTTETQGNVDVVLSDIAKDETQASAKVAKKLNKPKKDEELSDEGNKTEQQDNEAIVLASGCLGLIYLTKFKNRLSLEEINEAYPDLIKTLTSHEGVGFILVNSNESGPVAMGKDGKHYLNTGKVEGVDPLLNFGENIVKHLLKTNSFDCTPDILVNSLLEESGQVAAFEELIGSHGGVGGYQSMPFLMYPKEFRVPSEKIVGAGELHKVLKSFSKQLDNK